MRKFVRKCKENYLSYQCGEERLSLCILHMSAYKADAKRVEVMDMLMSRPGNGSESRKRINKSFLYEDFNNSLRYALVRLKAPTCGNRGQSKQLVKDGSGCMVPETLIVAPTSRNFFQCITVRCILPVPSQVYVSSTN
jgi:hypothetical protein